MDRLTQPLISLMIALGMFNAHHAAHAQEPFTIIKVLDGSGSSGVPYPGVVLLVNPGNGRESQAFVTDAHGEAIVHGLQCDICMVSAFDPRNLSANRTTEFSSSRPSFSLVMSALPVVDYFFDPKAMRIELTIKDSKGEPLATHAVVIRPTLMVFVPSSRDNVLALQKTDSNGHVQVGLRAGDYTVAALDGDTRSEARFEVAATKAQCSKEIGTCIVASHSPQPYGRRYSRPTGKATVNLKQDRTAF